MVKNVGSTEKGIRLVLGGFFLIAALVLDIPSWGTATLSVLGLIAIGTGVMGYCPAWTLFGINTCQIKSPH